MLMRRPAACDPLCAYSKTGESLRSNARKDKVKASEIKGLKDFLDLFRAILAENSAIIVEKRRPVRRCKSCGIRRRKERRAGI
jgi:hypothetical protein